MIITEEKFNEYFTKGFNSITKMLHKEGGKIIDSGKTDLDKVLNAFVVAMGLEVPWFMIGMGFLICGMIELPALIIGCIGFEMVILNKEKKVCGMMLNGDFKIIACSRVIILVLLAFMMYVTVLKFPYMIFLTGAMMYSISFIVSYNLHTLVENKAKAFEMKKVNTSYMRKIA